MEPNFKWLWAAFSVAWALHVGYLWLITDRARKIESQIADLSEQLRQTSANS